jgi:Na+/melibiose symporter-like transporter
MICQGRSIAFNSASTGLIFSSSSMAQKFGSAFGGAMVMWFYPLTTSKMTDIEASLKEKRKLS